MNDITGRVREFRIRLEIHTRTGQQTYMRVLWHHMVLFKKTHILIILKENGICSGNSVFIQTGCQKLQFSGILNGSPKTRDIGDILNTQHAASDSCIYVGFYVVCKNNIRVYFSQHLKKMIKQFEIRPRICVSSADWDII